ncbi:MAG: hypothetical protein ACK4K9_10120 [Bacteroidia bacterium]
MYNTAIESLLKSNTVDAAVEAALSHIIPIAGGLAIVLFILTTAFNFFMNSIKSLKGGEGGSFFDFEEFIRTIIIVAIIFTYKPVVGTVTDLVDTLTKMTAVQEKVIQDLQAYADNTVNGASNPDSTIKTTVNSDINGYENNPLYNSNPNEREIGWFDKMVGYLDPITWFNMLLSSACALILAIIRIIISAFMFIVYKVLICLGPFALAFSVLPMFRNQADNWFGTLLGTGLVFVTLNILDVMFYEYVKSYITTANVIDNRLNYFANIAFNISIVISYLSAFWLTSKMIGKGDSGKILSKGVSLATMAAMAAVSGGASTAGSGATKMGNTGNVASSSKDAFKDGK